LIFYKALIQDEFDIYSISTADDLHLLQITDIENQKFNAIIINSNIFFIQKIIFYFIIVAVRKCFTTDKIIKFSLLIQAFKIA